MRMMSNMRSRGGCREKAADRISVSQVPPRTKQGSQQGSFDRNPQYDHWVIPHAKRWIIGPLTVVERAARANTALLSV